MGKSTVITQTTTDNSVMDALAGVRGDNNTTQVLDGGAIKDAYAYASRVGDNTSNNIGQLLGTVESVVGKTFAAQADSSSKTIAALQGATDRVQTAYTKQQNNGLDPQMLFLGLGVLAVVFMMKG